jgi:tetratricopeptide (TPR) repeat protein
MSGWATANLAEIEKRRNGWIPIRDHFGIRAFGVNAWTKRDSDGALIAAHSEETVGHEELYLVVRGHATITVGDDEIDASAGTIVFVRDPSVTRGAQPVDDDTMILTVGGKPGEAFKVSDWELGWEVNQRAFPLYEEGKYAEAAAVVREALERYPDNAGMHYNFACFASLAGEGEEAIEHLQRAFELSPDFFELAKTDKDLDPIRDDPRFPQARSPE